MPPRASIPQLTMSAWMRFDHIRRDISTVRPRRVLEIGAGQGGTGTWIARRYDYVALEPDAVSRSVAERRLATSGAVRVVGDLGDLPGETFDLVCAFEVLEHIADDGAALDQWRDLVVPKGFLLISVPAHSDRFSRSDAYVGHFRRYDAAPLRDLLEEHDFDVVRARSYGVVLPRAIELVRNALLRRRRHAPSREEGTAMSGRLFQPERSLWAMWNYLVAVPFRLLESPLARTDLGIGYVVLAQRRS
jgi:SAM-dependent methyltransferase